MASIAIYITVRLDIENENVDQITDEDVEEFISEMNYKFEAPEGDLTIYDTEICGRND